MRMTLEQRFWSKVDATGDCWEWMGAIHPSGYAQIAVNRAGIYVHRLAYELVNGPIMGTRPTKPGPWPYAQKRRAKLVAERAGHAIKHLDQARNSLDTRAHPAIVALDIADAQRILSDIVTEMRAALSGE